MNKEQRAELTESIKALILKLPKAKRLEADAFIHISKICSFFNIPQDFISEDRRGKHWTERSEEEKLEVKRKQAEKQRAYAAELRAKVRAERDKLKEYSLVCRGKFLIDVDINRASEILKLSPQSIYNKIAKAPNRIAHFVVDDEVYTIHRKNKK